MPRVPDRDMEEGEGNYFRRSESVSLCVVHVLTQQRGEIRACLG